VTAALAILITTAIGAPAAWRLRMPGLAFLFGSGIVYLALLAGFQIWLVVPLAALLFFVTPRKPLAPLAPHPLDLLTLALLVIYALYATAAAPWHWDYWAIWGLKARVFFEHGGIDFAFLHANAFAHPDYPLLVPLNYAFVAILAGEWDDRWLGLFMVAFAASLWLVARQLAARSTSPLAASAIGFAVAALACSQYIGLAEVPLIAFGTAALIVPDVRVAAILLGLAACTKNEGLTLLIAAVILRWRLWPSILIALPWLVVARVQGFESDLFTGNPFARLARDWPVELLFTRIDKPLCWLAVLAALPLALRRDKFVFGVVGLQLLFFLAAYAITPNDLAWHISTSWDRLSRQLIVPAAYAASIALVHRSTKGAAVAEARPEQ
jgi:hypothetical protein